MSLKARIKDATVVVSLAPEELARPLLSAAVSRQQGGQFHRDQLVSTFAREYPEQHLGEIELALTEAWRWLELNLFIVPSPGVNGQHGWFTLGKRGKTAMSHPEQFIAYTKAAAFPRELLHPTIVETVWPMLARGDYADAVFHAFRAVEEAVRKAGGYAETEVGVELMRRAFDQAKGPLARQSDPKPEREALAHLFAGAIGSYKNPHSHRTVTLADPDEAQEMVLLASHLLRIVDARKPKP